LRSLVVSIGAKPTNEANKTRMGVVSVGIKLLGSASFAGSSEAFKLGGFAGSLSHNTRKHFLDELGGARTEKSAIEWTPVS